MVHNRIDPPFTRYLDSDGRPLGELPAWAGDSDALVGLYRQMLLTRLFDQKAVALQRTGRIGTYAPTLGQEAIGWPSAARCAPRTCWCRITAIPPCN